MTHYFILLIRFLLYIFLSCIRSRFCETVKKTTTKKKHEQLPNENRYTRNRKQTQEYSSPMQLGRDLISNSASFSSSLG